MALSPQDIINALVEIPLPNGLKLSDHDMIRALSIDNGVVKFVIEAPNSAIAAQISPMKPLIERAVLALGGVTNAQIVITAHEAAPNLKIGRHPAPQPAGPQKIDGIKTIIAVASGKGGVGKSTVSSNLAVALARQGRKVGLLDADIHGPSQPRMMGVNRRPASPDGKTIIPLQAHGVTMISIGLMLKEDEAVIWRGPMLMGALQQLLGQVAWGALDVLVIDLPPGTGDVQLSLCQKTVVDGVIIVSTPQDVALIDARKAMDMFNRLKTPILGMVENMSVFCCPSCGHESAIFGHGGVEREAAQLGLPFLGALPLTLAVRLAGDAGTPIAAQDSAESAPYTRLATDIIARLNL